MTRYNNGMFILNKINLNISKNKLGKDYKTLF